MCVYIYNGEDLGEILVWWNSTEFDGGRKGWVRGEERDWGFEGEEK